jgi:hypothetical protein
MARLVYLFLDTNVLIQCPPLDQLDWSAWKDFEEVHLVISRPVQTEIDEQKNKGGERLARRARKASGIVRDLIVGEGEYILVRASGPCVKLFFNPLLRPSKELADILDYERADDQLVGIVHEFTKQHQQVDARVLTHDAGPMGTAKAVGIAVAPVPDDWLLPPEPSEADKRIRSLEAEVARLKEAEPNFTIACLDANGNELEKLELTVTVYDAIPDAELSTMLDRLKERIPIATDFGPRESAEQEAPGIKGFMGLKQVFAPATDKEIEEYQKSYANWLERCEETLRHLHRTLQSRDGPPTFVFAAANYGTRPANDALITFEALGRFEIMPPPYRHRADGEDDQDRKRRHSAVLPPAPAAPHGNWKTVLDHQFSYLDRLVELQRTVGQAQAMSLPTDVFRSPLPDLRIRRDSNLFYYKPDRPSVPSSEFALECEQWRHGVGPKRFVGQLHLIDDAKEISRALQCRIHAENLSESATKLIPVLIKVNHARASDIGQRLVERV